MCLCCDKIWTGLHILWAVIYVTCGSVQIVTGIFFLISIPTLKVCSNVWAGSWNVLAGIGSGMLACFGDTSPKRQEKLLYISISILVVNTINTVLVEWTFYNQDLFDANSPYSRNSLSNLIYYARLTAGISAITVLVASFLDSQLTFCSIDVTRASQRSKSSQIPASHEQVSDIEYIIPRPKSNSQSKPNTTSYSQSWVFESETSNTSASPYLKLSRDSPVQNHSRKSSSNNSEETMIVANPVVHIESATLDRNLDYTKENILENLDLKVQKTDLDRKIDCMKSFSRSTSPVFISKTPSKSSIHKYDSLIPISRSPVQSSPGYTSPGSVSPGRTGLGNLGLEEDCPRGGKESLSPGKTTLEVGSPGNSSLKMGESTLGVIRPRTTSLGHSTPVASPVSQYASLMVELEQTLSRKDKTDSSDSSEQKTEDFSKELEAALQLIQDLESPNIETPSDFQRPLGVWKVESSSERTLNEFISELTSPERCVEDSLYRKGGMRNRYLHTDPRTSNFNNKNYGASTPGSFSNVGDRRSLNRRNLFEATKKEDSPKCNKQINLKPSNLDQLHPDLSRRSVVQIRLNDSPAEMNFGPTATSMPSLRPKLTQNDYSTQNSDRSNLSGFNMLGTEPNEVQIRLNGNPLQLNPMTVSVPNLAHSLEEPNRDQYTTNINETQFSSNSTKASLNQRNLNVSPKTVPKSVSAQNINTFSTFGKHGSKLINSNPSILEHMGYFSSNLDGLTRENSPTVEEISEMDISDCQKHIIQTSNESSDAEYDFRSRKAVRPSSVDVGLIYQNTELNNFETGSHRNLVPMPDEIGDTIYDPRNQKLINYYSVDHQNSSENEEMNSEINKNIHMDSQTTISDPNNNLTAKNKSLTRKNFISRKFSFLKQKKTCFSEELESAIFKTVSLAHLTEDELLERNRELHRLLEQRVQQQKNRMTESNC